MHETLVAESREFLGRGRRLLARGWNEATALAMRIRWHRVGVALSACIIAVSVFILWRRLQNLDIDRVVAALRAKPWHEIAAAAAAIATSYVTLTFYDWFALRTIGKRHVPYRIAALTSFTSYSIGHNIGATVFTGGAIRYRIYSAWGLRVIDIAKLCFVTGLTFWLGNLMVLGLGMVYVPAAASAVDHLPPLANRMLGIAALVALGGYLTYVWRKPRAFGTDRWQVTLPDGPLTLLQLLIGLADLFFCALAIALLRGSYEAVTQDLLHALGARRHALLAGSGESLERLRQGLGAERSGIDYEFVGALAPSPDGIELPVLGNLHDLPLVLAERRVDELIVTDSDFSERELLEIVSEAHRRGVQVRIAPKTTELLTQRAEFVPGQGIPLFELRPPVFIGLDWFVKRGFDLVVSGLVLLLGLPLWLAIAAAVKLSSRGPVFYRDTRVGLGEREFGMLKFRTMQADASGLQAELEASNEADGPLFKMKNDPRVTKLGGFLRRLSLDEAPQVLNVLRGEMSLVGPRPLPLRDYVQLEPWHRKRYHVLPGITGLWQVSGRINLSFDDLVRLDFYYLDNWSIWLDISILAKTLPAVLAGRGAY